MILIGASENSREESRSVLVFDFHSLPALYRPKRRWTLAGQENPDEYTEAGHDTETVWRSNYPTVDELAEKAEEVLEDQVKRGQVVKLSEEDAKRLYLGLVIASIGANRKEKSHGSITARVLHDGSNGIAVNKRTSVWDPERGPMASYLKRAMREKAKSGETTFSLTAGVKEAHRQIPVAREDWWLLGCRVRRGTYVYTHTHGRHIRYIASFVLLVEDRIRDWQIDAIRCRPVCYYLGYVSGRPLSREDEWRRVSDWTYHFSLSSARTASHVWVSNCSTSPIYWVYLSAGRNGFADGVRKRRKRKR